MSDPFKEADEAWKALEEQPRPLRRLMRWPGALFGLSAFVVASVVTLCAPPAESGPRDRNRTERIYGGSYAFFEFAPLSGAGMGTACACATPTGAKGEAMTFTRASSGTCLKGNTTTGVANGDMVTCSTNQPRVMPGGDGSGALGLLVEAARTNSILQTEHFENAAWTKAGGGAVAPTVTADQAVAPDGNTTADRIQVPATPNGTDFSVVFQSFTGTAAPWSFYVFVRGNGGSGSTYLAVNLAGASYSRTLCSFVSATASLCKLENITLTAASWTLAIGTDRRDASQSDRGAQDFFAWGIGGEAGAYATSYIATTSAAVTRADELADVALTFGAGTTGISIASSVVQDSLNGASNPALVFFGDRAPGFATGSAQYFSLELASASLRAIMECTNPPCSSTIGGTNATAINPFREYAYFDGANAAICMNGACDTGARTYAAPAFTRVRLGNYNATTQGINGVVKQVCLDPSPTRCR